MPDAVLTMLPDGIRLVLVGSRFSNRTVPVALVSSTRLPVAANVSLTETGIEIRCGGHDRRVAAGRRGVRVRDDRQVDRGDRLGPRRHDDRGRRQQDVRADRHRRAARGEDGRPDEPRRPDAAAAASVGRGDRWRPAAADGPGRHRARLRRPGHLARDRRSDGLARVGDDRGRRDQPERAVMGRRAAVSLRGDRRDDGRTAARRRAPAAAAAAEPRERRLVLRHRREHRQARPTPPAPASPGRPTRSTAASRAPSRRATAAGS